MRLVGTRQAIELTGLSRVKLREWTSRRALIPADVPPKDRGSPAQFSWQTILLLRLAVTLRDRFHLELQAHQGLFAELRDRLQTTSFLALWDQALVIYPANHWAVIATTDFDGSNDALFVTLNSHLLTISRGFALPSPVAHVGQLDLFPATPVSEPRAARRQGSSVGAERPGRRRRSA